MLKKLAYVALGAMFAAMVGTASAIIGTPPGTGFQLVDGNWLNGLANGQNNSAKYGISAAGSTQADSTQLTPQIHFYQVDTVSSGQGVAMPAAVASGISANIYNSTATALKLYPSIVNNPVTLAQDTLNSATSLTISSTSALICFVAKQGVWACR